MKLVTLFFVVFLCAAALQSQTYKNAAFENSPIGFAAVNSFGQNGTTGGAGGDTTVFTTRAALQAFMNARAKAKTLTPKVCVVQGTILNDTSISQIYVKRVANLTIIGKGTDAMLDGLGLAIISSKNIIVRNILMRNAKPDCITISTTTTDTCHHIWIDHCTFSDDPEVDLSSGGTHDGLLDITHRSSYITVSWCEFHNHDKVCLLGYTDNATDEIPFLYTTYHHNWWNNTVQRHPRVRHTLCHAFDNYYDGSKTPTTQIGMGTDLGVGYGITSTCEADVLVESNYFDHVFHPTEIGQDASPAGDLIERYNFTNNGPILTRNTHTTPFEANTYYSYSLDSASSVPSIVKAGAGAGKLGGSTGVKDARSGITPPASFSLAQNFPNPFNPSTMITYTLPSESKVVLKVYDQLGKEIATLVNEQLAAGSYTSSFNAANLPSGLYFYTLKSASFTQTRKMLLLK